MPHTILDKDKRGLPCVNRTGINDFSCTQTSDIAVEIVFLTMFKTQTNT